MFLVLEARLGSDDVLADDAHNYAASLVAADGPLRAESKPRNLVEGFRVSQWCVLFFVFRRLSLTGLSLLRDLVLNDMNGMHQSMRFIINHGRGTAGATRPPCQRPQRPALRTW
jgi:hypothetical protein